MKILAFDHEALKFPSGIQLRSEYITHYHMDRLETLPTSDAIKMLKEMINSSSMDNNSTQNTLFSNVSLNVELHNESFFDVYYSVPRFSIETVLASAAGLCNISVLLAVKNAKGRRSVYNTLFVNLAVANILSCALSWLCNNILMLFSRRLISFPMCTIFVYMTAAAFVSNAFGLVSTLIMLGFATVQYFAVCHPLHHISIVTTKRIRVFIITSWTFSVAAGCLPWVILLGLSSKLPCDIAFSELLEKVMSTGSNICVSSVSIVYITIISICVRIYTEIQSIHQCIMRYRQERSLKAERRAFVTIVILLATLTVFFIPHTIAYLVSVNIDRDKAMDKSVLIYYMNMMPYFKFLLDPLIYGLRMREVRDGCIHILFKLGIHACMRVRSQRGSSVRSGSYTLTRSNSALVSHKESTYV